MMPQAAEISKGRTVSQLMAYSQEQAKPKEGSTKRQMYMVKAPLTGYKTDNSARACIMRYVEVPEKMLADRYVATIAIATDSPMIMKPRSTEAGPPFWKAPADPTKRPAPMAPPLRISSQYCALSCDNSHSASNSHGNHLHMSAFKTAVQCVLAILETLPVGAIGRSIVVRLLTERRAGL
jgi:hypothetical protein